MFGRVPEQYELLEEIERLKIIEEKYKDSQLYIHDFKEEIERLNNIINKAIEYAEESYCETVDGIEGIAKFFNKRNEILLKILKRSDSNE